MTEITGIDHALPKETEQLKPIQRLQILVHPSFLVENTTHPVRYKGRREKPHYEKMTKAMQERALERMLPDGPNSLLLVMPHETPSLQSWRDSLEAKKGDPDLGNWTDFYKAAKTQTQYKENVFLVGDLAMSVNENSKSQVEQAHQDVQRELVEMLKQRGFQITSDTDIAVGGEFRDLCVYETAKKILLLPQVRRLKIDQVASFNSSHALPFEPEYIIERDESYQAILLAILDEYTVGDDGDFLYIEKPQGET